jgi:excisionase family DNA binding protein
MSRPAGLLRLCDVAKQLGLSRDTIKIWIIKGKMKAINPNGVMYVPVEEIEKFMKRHEVKVSPAVKELYGVKE